MTRVASVLPAKRSSHVSAEREAVSFDQTNMNNLVLETSRVRGGAGDAIRTRDIFLGKEVLYH